MELLKGVLPLTKPREISGVAPDLMGKKLVCKVWDSDGSTGVPRRLAKKTVKYGAPSFTAKIGGVKRLFQINYEDFGAIKQEGNFFVYDTTFDNTTGSLAFHEFPEEMDSSQAFTVFLNTAVKMYVAKGGIPLHYLIIAVFGALFIAGACAYLGVEVSKLNQQHQVDINDLTTASQTIRNLRTQVTGLGGIPVG